MPLGNVPTFVTLTPVKNICQCSGQTLKAVQGPSNVHTKWDHMRPNISFGPANMWPQGWTGTLQAKRNVLCWCLQDTGHAS